MKEMVLVWMERGDALLLPIAQTAIVLCMASLVLAIPKRTRHWSGWVLVITAWLIGLKAWLMGAHATLLLWGWLGLLVGSLLLGFGVVPTAIVATLTSGEHDLTIISALCIMVVLAILIRWLGLWLIVNSTGKENT